MALLLEGSSSYREIKNHPSHLTDEETGLGDKVNTCIPRGEHQELSGQDVYCQSKFHTDPLLF